MRALLAVGGEAPPFSRIRELEGEFPLVCAADSGLDLLEKWGLEPQLIVGDMDSLSDRAALDRHLRASITLLPRDKDESDTEAGLALCRGAGAETVVVVGGGGGRLDHLLAIRALFERDFAPVRWHLASDSVYLVAEASELSFEASRDSLVSIFPLAAGASDFSSEGLKWPLRGLSWDAGHCSLSNVATGGLVRIKSGHGRLLVVRRWG